MNVSTAMGNASGTFISHRPPPMNTASTMDTIACVRM